MKKYIVFILLISAFNHSFSQIPPYIPSPGLLAWYPFTGNADDSSGYGHNGVLYGDATYDTDRFGIANRCFLADGSSAVDFPVNNFPTGDAARSVSVFFKLPPTATGGIRELFAWGNNIVGGDRFGLVMVGDTSIGFESDGFGILSHFNADTLWHNLTVTYPGGGSVATTLKIYIDGVITAPEMDYYTTDSLLTDTGYIHCAGSLTFGAYYQYGWNGKLDDIGIWNRELTGCEVKGIFLGTPVTPVISDSASVLSTLNTFVSYQWLYNGVPIPGATGSSYTAVNSGLYQVAITTDSGCRDTSAAYSTVLAVQSVLLADKITVFPNPSNTVINITSPVEINVQLTNMIGQTIFYLQNVKQLDLSTMPPGIYTLSIFTAEGIKIKTEQLSWLGTR